MTGPISQYDDDLRTIAAMRQFGGSFVKALAEAAARADAGNLAILRAAFPGYWADYRAMAIKFAIEP